MPSRLALAIDLPGIKACELKGHEIPLDLDQAADLFQVQEGDTLSYAIHAVEGRVLAYAAFIHNESKTILARMSTHVLDADQTAEFILVSLKMLPRNTCKTMTVVLNELDMEKYSPVVNFLLGRFVGRIPGQEQRAYGQTFDSYSYEVTL